MYYSLDSFNRYAIYYKKPHSSCFASKNYALYLIVYKIFCLSKIAWIEQYSYSLTIYVGYMQIDCCKQVMTEKVGENMKKYSKKNMSRI